MFFIKKMLKHDNFVKNKSDLIIFYKNIEEKFYKISIEYLNKTRDVIDELIKDTKPYMENLSTQHFYDITDNTELLNDIIKELWFIC